MAFIHVLIRGAPRMLQDILEQVIADEPDMELMTEQPRSVAAPAMRWPDVVVDASDADAAERGRALLEQWPHSHVLTIRASGHQVSMYQLVPQSRELGELSPRQLVDVIRTVVRPERPRWTH